MNKEIKYIVIILIFSLFFVETSAQKDKFNDIPGTVIAHQPALSKKYIGSPSIVILSNGDYVASHDFFGPESSEWVQAISRIYLSKDKGKNWKQIAEINGAFWSSLFVHRGELYFLGPDRHHGSLVIRKSIDGGLTWTKPTNKANGLLLAGEYHCAPMPVIEHNGRLWRAMETAHGPIRQWGKRYGAMMISAPVNVDLLKADSWTSSNSLLYDSTYLNGNFAGWLEGNAVVTPDGRIVDILRVSDRTTLRESAAVVHVSSDGKVVTFDPLEDFISFPGGSKKFAIRYDEDLKCYWTLSNFIPEKIKAQNPNRSPGGIRNTLALMSSTDLINWKVNKVILSHPDVENHGFQYVDWQFEGKDIIFLSRTAYEDGEGGAHNNHNANFLTFHRIKNFRKLKDKRVK